MSCIDCHNTSHITLTASFAATILHHIFINLFVFCAKSSNEILHNNNLEFAATAASATTLAYVYENGLHKNSQLVGYVTAVQFKGKITPKAVWEKDGEHTVKSYVYSSGDLYFYDNKFYKDLAAVNADANLGLANDAQAKDFNVKKYTGGVCYYVYYIRHWNNGILPPSTGALGIMEYSIVRNNSYQITVTEINSTGDDEMTESTPTAETPATETPAEAPATTPEAK